MADPEVLVRGRASYCFNQEKFKNGYGLYCLWRNKCGFRPQVPPLDPPLVIEVANVGSTDTDGDSLMLISQYFITQMRRKSDLCFQNLKAWRNWPTLLTKHYCLFLCH